MDLLKKIANALLTDGFKKKLKLYATIAAVVVCTVVIIVAAAVGAFASGSGGGLTQGMETASQDAWEQFIRYLRQCEGGGTIYKNAEGIDCYKVNPDGGGGYAVGYGVDIATHGARLRNLGYDTSNGALIPVSVVDPIEKEEIEARYNDVKNLAVSNGIELKEYQIFALTSRTYNYGFTGGTGQATDYFKYPSTLTFVEAYKAYYNQEEHTHYGDYTKTDFNNQLFTQYMTWLAYASSGTTPPGWITRRKSEWCLFQTGYYGWGLKNGGAHPSGFDEYWQESYGGGSGEVANYSFNSEDYTIVENAIEIQQTANKNGYDQDSTGLGDKCLGFAFAYAGSINTGTTNKITGAPSESVKVNWDSTVYKSKVESSNKQDVVKAIYDQLSSGKACIIHVVGSFKNSNPATPNTRHYVVAIGYKKGKTRDTIKDTDLIIIDTWDSKIEQLVQEYTGGGRYLLDGQDVGQSYRYQMYNCK